MPRVSVSGKSRRSELPSTPARSAVCRAVKIQRHAGASSAPTTSAAISAMLDGLLGLRARCDVLVVDDSSTDGTLRRCLATSRCRPIRVSAWWCDRRKLGIGSAHKLGWLHARRMGYARIATLDADLSHDPADVQRLLDALDCRRRRRVWARASCRAAARLSAGFAWRSAGAPTDAGVRRCCACRSPSTPRRCVRPELARVPDGLVETIESDGYAILTSPAWCGWRAPG